MPVPSPSPTTTTPSLARVEWEHINRVLADSGGNISEAARRLGLHRRSLQRKLEKYPVPPLSRQNRQTRPPRRRKVGTICSAVLFWSTGRSA